MFPDLVERGDRVYVWGHDGKEPEQYSERESLPSFNRTRPRRHHDDDVDDDDDHRGTVDHRRTGRDRGDHGADDATTTTTTVP